MSAIAEGNDRRKRRSRVPSGPAGARLVLDELLRRGFDAELAGSCTKKYDVLVGQCAGHQSRFMCEPCTWVHGMSAFPILLEPLQIKSRSTFSLASETIRVALVSSSPGTATW